MPQGSKYDAEGNVLWQFDICTEFDCNVEFAKGYGRDCKGDFTKLPCMFYAEHVEMNEDKSLFESLVEENEGKN